MLENGRYTPNYPRKRRDVCHLCIWIQCLDHKIQYYAVTLNCGGHHATPDRPSNSEDQACCYLKILFAVGQAAF